MATTYTTYQAYTATDWAAIFNNYYTNENWNDWTNKVSEPPMPKVPPKPPRMEFNVKAKGWVPPAKKHRMSEDTALDYIDAKGYQLDVPFKDGFGKGYMIGKDEAGYYWMEA